MTQASSKSKEFTMIRTKKINYLDSPAIAVYLLNMTQHVKQIRLESQILEEKNRNQSLESFTSTISHEFRTPVSNALMILEQLLEGALEKSIRQILVLVFVQLNMLLCLVNDILDIKMISSG